LGGEVGYPGHGGLPTGRDLPGRLGPVESGTYVDWLGLAGALAALGLARGLLGSRRRPVLIVGGWGLTVVLAYATGPYLLLDLLRFTPLIPVGLDYTSFAARAVLAMGALCLALSTAAYQRRTRGDRRLGRSHDWLGCVAAALAMPYALLKAVWSLGAGIGWTAGDQVNAFASGWGTVLVALLGVPLGILLARRWILPRFVPVLGGRPLPRWMVLTPAWLAVAILMPFGLYSVTLLVDLLTGQPPADPGGRSARVYLFVYGSFGLWSAVLAAAATNYHRHHGQCDANTADSTDPS